MTIDERPVPSYSRIAEWVREYGSSGADDMRALRDYIEIEANESISSLRTELHSLARGNYIEETIQKLVGAKRKVRHGTFDEWAKSMLRWMAAK